MHVQPISNVCVCGGGVHMNPPHLTVNLWDLRSVLTPTHQATGPDGCQG